MSDYYKNDSNFFSHYSADGEFIGYSEGLNGSNPTNDYNHYAADGTYLGWSMTSGGYTNHFSYDGSFLCTSFEE